MTTSEGQPWTAAGLGPLPLVVHPAIPPDTPRGTATPQRGEGKQATPEKGKGEGKGKEKGKGKGKGKGKDKGKGEKKVTEEEKEKQKKQEEKKKEKEMKKKQKQEDKKKKAAEKELKNKEKKEKKAEGKEKVKKIKEKPLSGCTCDEYDEWELEKEYKARLVAEAKKKMPVVSGTAGAGLASAICDCPNVVPLSRPLICRCPCQRPYWPLVAAAQENLWYEANSRRFEHALSATQLTQRQLRSNRRVASKLKRSVICRCVLCRNQAKVYSREEVFDEAPLYSLHWQGEPREMCFCYGRPCVCSIATYVPNFESEFSGGDDQDLQSTLEGMRLWKALQKRLNKEVCYDYATSPFKAGRVSRFCVGLGMCFRMLPPAQPCRKVVTTASLGTSTQLPCDFAKSQGVCECITSGPCRCHFLSKRTPKETRTMDDGDKQEGPDRTGQEGTKEGISKTLNEMKGDMKDEIKTDKKEEMKTAEKKEKRKKKSKKRAEKQPDVPKPPPPLSATPEVGDLLLRRTWIQVQGLRILDPTLRPDRKLPNATLPLISFAQTFCDRGRAKTCAREVNGKVVGRMRWEGLEMARAGHLEPTGCICPTSPCRCGRHALPASKNIPHAHATYSTPADMSRTWSRWQQKLKMEPGKQPYDPQLGSHPVSCVNFDRCVLHGNPMGPRGARVRSICVPKCSNKCVITGSLAAAAAAAEGDATPADAPPGKQVCVCYVTAQYDRRPPAAASPPGGQTPTTPEPWTAGNRDNIYWFFKDRRIEETQTSTGDQVPTTSTRQLWPSVVEPAPVNAPPPTGLKRFITECGCKLLTAKYSFVNWLFDGPRQGTAVKSNEVQVDIPNKEVIYECECLPMENLEDDENCQGAYRRLCQSLMKTSSSEEVIEVGPRPPPPHPAERPPQATGLIPDCSRSPDNGMVITWLAATTPDGKQQCVLKKRRNRSRLYTSAKSTVKSLKHLIKSKKEPEVCPLRRATGKVCTPCGRNVPCKCCVHESGMLRECEECKIHYEHQSGPGRTAITAVLGPCGWVTSVKDQVKCMSCKGKKKKKKKKPKKSKSKKTLEPTKKTYKAYVVHDTSSEPSTYSESTYSGSGTVSTISSSSLSFTYSTSDSSESSLSSKEPSHVTPFQNSVHITYYGQTKVKRKKEKLSNKPPCTCGDDKELLKAIPFESRPPTTSVKYVYDENITRIEEGSEESCTCLMTGVGRIKCLSCNKDVEDIINLAGGIVNEEAADCECKPFCKVQGQTLAFNDEENPDAMLIRDLIRSRIGLCSQVKCQKIPKPKLKEKLNRLFKGFRGVMTDEPSVSSGECIWKFGTRDVCPPEKQTTNTQCTCEGSVRGASCEAHHQQQLNKSEKLKKKTPPPLCGWLSKAKNADRCDACNTEMDFIKDEHKFESIFTNKFKPEKDPMDDEKMPLSLALAKSKDKSKAPPEALPCVCRLNKKVPRVYPSPGSAAMRARAAKLKSQEQKQITTTCKCLLKGKVSKDKLATCKCSETVTATKDKQATCKCSETVTATKDKQATCKCLTEVKAPKDVLATCKCLSKVKTPKGILTTCKCLSKVKTLKGILAICKCNPKAKAPKEEPRKPASHKEIPTTKKGFFGDSLMNFFTMDDESINLDVIAKRGHKNVLGEKSGLRPQSGYTDAGEKFSDEKSKLQTCGCDIKKYQVHSPELTQKKLRANVLGDDGSTTPPLPPQKILGRNYLPNFFINEDNYNEQFRPMSEYIDSTIEETDKCGTVAECSQHCINNASAETPLTTPPCSRYQTPRLSSNNPAVIDVGEKTPPLYTKYRKL